jgi:CheY-like chemotaxis protein
MLKVARRRDDSYDGSIVLAYCVCAMPTQPLRVLIAEDDGPIRTLLVTALTREGFATESVPNGRDAVDRIVATKYDVILLDLMMPFMTGVEVMNYMQIAAPDQLRECVIVLTAASGRDLANIEGKPVYRVLRKPFDLSQLISTIHDCISERPHRAADAPSLPR